MFTIIVEENKPTMWGPEGNWVAYTDSYCADQPEWRAVYHNDPEKALQELMEALEEDDEFEEVQIFIGDEVRHGYKGRATE